MDRAELTPPPAAKLSTLALQADTLGADLRMAGPSTGDP